jgi:ATP-binding cassette subfamily C protein CydC
VAGQRRFIRLGMVCAVLASLSAVGLLALSGWFLVGAALAGMAGPLAVQGFNYLLPSAGIRAAAILRTGTRYGEGCWAIARRFMLWPRCARAVRRCGRQGAGRA